MSIVHEGVNVCEEWMFFFFVKNILVLIKLKYQTLVHLKSTDIKIEIGITYYITLF